MVERARPGRGESGSRRTRVMLLIKGLGRGGAEQLVVNAAEHGDASRFDYHVAYLLPSKTAFVPNLRALGIPTVCLDGARGFTWLVRLSRLIRDRDIDVVHIHSPYVAALVRGFLRGTQPIVATEHNGFSESIVPGCSGLLVPECDAPALARALADLLSRPAAWPEMGRAGREHVEATYGASRVCADLVVLYGGLLRSRGRVH